MLLLLVSNFCPAQENIMNEPPPQPRKETPKKSDIRTALSYLIPRNGTNKHALVDGPTDYAYFFSVTLSIDEIGKIENVYFSKSLPKNLVDFLGTPSGLLAKINAANLECKEYASKLVLIPFFYYRMDSSVIDYRSGFLKSMENLLPTVDDKMSQKSWIILDTMINSFGAIE